MSQTNIPAAGPLEAVEPALSGAKEALTHLTRPEVLANTGAELAGLAAEVGRVALPIAGIAYLTVAGIKTLFGYPPDWMKKITGSSLNTAA